MSYHLHFYYSRAEKDDNKVILEDKDLEVIGSPAVVQYDDTTVILQHIESGLWLSYKVVQQFYDTELVEQTAYLIPIS